MKKSYLLGLGLALLAAIALWMLQPKEAEGVAYPVQGKITGFGDQGVVFIHHETIPNFMESMTMPFTVKDPAILQGFQTNDAISFQYHVTDLDSWIEDLKKIAPDKLKLPADTATPAPVNNGTAYLQAGDPLPSIQLQNQDGKPFDVAVMQGKTRVFTFIYTACPDPTLCPRMSSNFQLLQRRLKVEAKTDVELVSITFDPQRDTPQVMKSYGSRYTSDFSNWTFATGTLEQVDDLSSRLGVVKRDVGGGILEHTLATIVVAPSGKVLKIFRGNEWKVEDIWEAIKLAH